MKPYSPTTDKSRTVAVDDVHHRSAHQPCEQAKAAAKALKHSARRQGRSAQVWSSGGMTDDEQAAARCALNLQHL